MASMCETCKCSTYYNDELDIYSCESGCECCNDPNYISPEESLNRIVRIIWARRAALIKALDDARNDVPISDDEYYESDAHYEAAIETLDDLIKEIQEIK